MISGIDIRDWLVEEVKPLNKTESNEGWKCPICKTIWAPEIKSCPKCVVKEESSNQGPQLLLENDVVSFDNLE